MNEFNKAKLMLNYNQSIQSRLDEILDPLKIFSITNFAYGKITKDQKYFRIGNHGAYTDLFFKLELYNQNKCYRGLLTPSGFKEEKQKKIFLWDVNDKNTFTNYRRSVDMWNGISFYNITKNLIETWAFGGTTLDTGLPSFYLNNMDLLNKFILYFRTVARDIIDISDQSKTMNITFHDAVDDSSKIDSAALGEFNKKISLPKYLITSDNHEFFLTSREIELLRYKNQGLTAKEIARIFNISYRSVEDNLDYIRIKSHLKNIKQVLSLCNSTKIL
ncbi:MAG: LuxR C-terminal-related transcriptional regulator [Candidatus Paracaedibacteraceae bacterium]|nr:LuxR C-terminal-related transcriptional regulator [Candidatus Paracaedibacteraceae bacterium]